MIKLISKTTTLLLAAMYFCFSTSCNQTEDYALDGPLPEVPEFSIEAVPDDPNRFVVTDLSEGNFTRLWEFGTGATPRTSNLKQDTVFYNKKGTYTVKLHISAADGNGTNYNEKDIDVAEDAPLSCSGTLLDLTGECTKKCWRFTSAPGAIGVGPVELSTEWFSSSELVATQLDDLWCFDIETFNFDYQNNGSSFSRCQGYIEVEDYPIPENALFDFLPGAGYQGADRIVLLDDASWMGVENSGSTYDIISINATELVLLTPIRPCQDDGAGFFTLTFTAE